MKYLIFLLMLSLAMLQSCNHTDITGGEDDTNNPDSTEIVDEPNMPEPNVDCDPANNPHFAIEENIAAKEALIGKWVLIACGNKKGIIPYKADIASYTEFLPTGKIHYIEPGPSSNPVPKYIIGDTLINIYQNACPTEYSLEKYTFIHPDTLRFDYLTDGKWTVKDFEQFGYYTISLYARLKE